MANWRRRVAGLVGVAGLGAVVGCQTAGTTGVLIGARVIEEPTARLLGKARGGASRGPAVRGAGREVADGGTRWERRLYGSDGRPLDAGAYAPGDSVTVEWRLPFVVGNGLEAVVAGGAGGPAGCAAGARASRRVQVVPVGEGSGGGRAGAAGSAAEVWTTEGDVAGAMALPALAAAEVGRMAGAGPLWQVRWVVFPERAGRYELRVQSTGDDVDGMLRDVPCVTAWRGVSRERVTDIQRLALDGGRGAGRGAAGKAVGAAPVDTAELGARLGLVGVAAYDLVRLHDEALRAEGEAFGPSHAREPARAARELRAARLAQLGSEGRAGERAMCDLVRTHGLAARPLRLWGGEGTVPVRVASVCGGGEGGR